jgi:hypothetical protein
MLNPVKQLDSEQFIGNASSFQPCRTPDNQPLVLAQLAM